jgi:hypothetical protein
MTLQIGVIGVGMIGQDHIRRLTTTLAGASIVAVSDVDAKQAQEVAGRIGAKTYATGEELIAATNVDAVIVASWGPTHGRYVLACIAAGKPCFCEKPLAETVVDCEAVLDAEAKHGRIVAGTIFDDLVSTRNLENLLRQVDEICALITALPRPETLPGQRFPAPYLTVMDWGHDERDYAAGHPDRAPRLDRESWDGMVANIHAIAELAAERYGVRAVSLRSPCAARGDGRRVA